MTHVVRCSLTFTDVDERKLVDHAMRERLVDESAPAGAAEPRGRARRHAYARLAIDNVVRRFLETQS